MSLELKLEKFTELENWDFGVDLDEVDVELVGRCGSCKLAKIKAYFEEENEGEDL
jgi:hypothetical protein